MEVLRRRDCVQTIQNVEAGQDYACRNAVTENLIICQDVGAWIPLSYQEMGKTMAKRWGRNLEESQINRVGLDERSLSKDLRKESVIATGLGLFKMDPTTRRFQITDFGKDVLLEAWPT